MTLICFPPSLPCLRPRLAGEGRRPYRDVGGPSGDAGCESPASDTAEEVSLSRAGDISLFDFPTVPVIYDTVRECARRHETPKPPDCRRIVLIVPMHQKRPAGGSKFVHTTSTRSPTFPWGFTWWFLNSRRAHPSESHSSP